MKTNDAFLEHFHGAIPHHIVAQRAYAIWLAEGQPAGCDYGHWVAAEAQLLALQLQKKRGSLSVQLTYWDDPLGTDIERALDSIASSRGPRSVTSL